MIKFYNLYFSDEGILKYAEHRGKKFFCNSPLWSVVCENSEYNIYSMTDFSFKKEDDYIELVWKSDMLNVSVTIIHNDKYEFNA